MLMQIGRLHCRFPWWEDATVSFMLSGGYNVSTQVKQVYMGMSKHSSCSLSFMVACTRPQFFRISKIEEKEQFE